MSGSELDDQHLFDDADDWSIDLWDDDADEAEPQPVPGWRRPLVMVVAAITALSLALVPLYNVVFARTVADNGLEVCGFDYCVVQDAVREAGLDLVMSSLANTYLDEEEARALASGLTGYLGVDPIGLRVVSDLEGRLGGVYDPESRSIAIESPARAWTVVHEVAHAVHTGHGQAFQDVMVDLAAWMETSPLDYGR